MSCTLSLSEEPANDTVPTVIGNWMILVSDIHIACLAVPGALDEICSLAKKDKNKVVVIAGDFVQQGSYEEYTAINHFVERLINSEITVVATPGFLFRGFFALCSIFFCW